MSHRELNCIVYGQTWSPEALLMYHLLLKVLEPTERKLGVGGDSPSHPVPMVPRQVVVEMGGPPPEGSLIIEALDARRVRVTVWGPNKEIKKQVDL